MNPKDQAQVLEEIAVGQLPPQTNLLPGIRARIEQGNQASMKQTRTLRLAALLLALALIIVFFSLPGVASALQKLIGYIPGVGEVDQSAPLRVLASPVSAEQGGFTITVENAVLDAARSVLEYRITGDFPNWGDPTLQPVLCHEPPYLRLADGSRLEYPRREGSLYGGEARWKDIYPPLPVEAGRAVLVLPCLSELAEGAGPQNWEIPLVFAPAPPEMTVFPVILAETPTAQPGPATPATPGAGSAMLLSLKGFSALEEGYYLQAELSWAADPALQGVELFPDALHLFDSAGQEVAVWRADSFPPAVPGEDLAIPLNLQTAALPAGEVRLVVDYVGVRLAAETSFTVDVGDNPQPGQRWELNQDLEINGYPLRVRSAEYVDGPPGEPAWMMLYLESDGSILTINAGDPEHAIMATGGSPASPNVPFRAGWRYQADFPSGIIRVEITAITVRRAGPWTLAWTPPGAPASPGTAPAARPQVSGACQQAAANPVRALPAGLNGRIAFYDKNREMFVARLDGSGRVPLGIGLIPALSPDGRQIVYRGQDEGLHVRDLGTGEDRLIPGTIHPGVFDTWPVWSTDGQQIAFNRLTGQTADIYRWNTGGADPQPVVDSPEEELLLGWSPDGQALAYRVMLADGVSVRVLHTQAGQPFAVALLPPEAMQISLTPDGVRLVYSTEHGLFLDRLDGSDPLFLLDSTSNLANPIWSPDGQWIAMMHWDSPDQDEYDLALLQPDTCQFILLEDVLNGLLSSWAAGQ